MSEDQNDFELIIEKSKFEELIKNSIFIDMLDLARIENALAFCNQTVIDYPGETPVSVRQRFRAFFFTIGILHEGLKKIQNLERKYGHKKSFKSKAFDDGFRKLLAESSVINFLENFSDNVRDKTAFHFDKDIIKTALRNKKGFKLDKFIFAKADSEKAGDIYFVLADEIDFNYHLSLIGKDNSIDDLKEVVGETMEILSKYLKASSEFIVEQMYLLLK